MPLFIIFLGLVAGGILTGLVMGKILSFIIKRVQTNKAITISFMLLMPFVTYLLAEELHVSGVIAVVVLGVGIARFSKKVFPDHLKEQSKSFWDIILFLLNGLIFILIGLEFPYVIKTLQHGQLWAYIGYAFLITVVALALRMARVFLQQVNLQKAFKRLQQAPEQPKERRSRRVGRGRGWERSRPRITEEALFDARTSFIISWSGMRGIVSLAIAIGLPTELENGAPFPQRNAIIFISVAVVLFTIIGQGLTLPWIVRKLKRPDGVDKKLI